MKTIVFYKKSKINKYNQILKQPSYYFIKKVTSIFFFKIKYEVVFFNNQDITDFLNKKIIDLISNEFELIIKFKDIKIKNLQEILVTLDTSNNNLLFGKFGQNKTSIEKYFSLVCSRVFLTKIKINFKFLNKKHNFTNKNNNKKLSQK